MSQVDERREQLCRDLPGAAARGEIVAVYQPQFSLATDRIVAAETLSRWLHPELGPIGPAEFIPISEEVGAIQEIGDRMIELGIQAAAHWCDLGFHIEVAINVSALQLRDPAFVRLVRENLTAISLDPSVIILEITESIAVYDVPRALEAAKALAKLGLTISIDDFGSGFSSEDQAVALPATELKIDRSLVQGDGPASTDLLAEAVEFGRIHGMRTIAEGVETLAQLERVKRLGCDRAQGFLLARPMQLADLDARLLADD
jgi:EAL domain-containing protein (putative c-di-GMP-specific phosphodiesterase class I)